MLGDDVAGLLLVGEDNNGRRGTVFEQVLEFSAFVLFSFDEFDDLFDGIHFLTELSDGNGCRPKVANISLQNLCSHFSLFFWVRGSNPT